MRAFILAGGFATRLWPLTERRAKPLLPLAGKPILSSIVEQIPADIPVTISTNAVLEEGFRSWEKTCERPLEILIEDTRNDDQKLGALGAVRQWIREHHVDEDILLLTGDNYFGFDLSAFLRCAQGPALLAAHDVGDRERARAFGTVILGPDRRTIEAFEEKPLSPRTSLVSTGCSLLPKSALPTLMEFAKHHPDNVGGIFEELLRRGDPVECFTFTEHWFDIGSFEAYLEATQALVGDHMLSESTAILKNVETRGSVVIGKNSHVEESSLKNVVLFEGCTVRDCVLENCILDRHCHLEGIDLTGKMLRENSRLVRH